MNCFEFKHESADQLSKTFKETKIAIIDKLFEETFANQIATDMISEHRAGKDYATSHPRSPEHLHHGILNNEKNRSFIQNEKELATSFKSDSSVHSRFYYRVVATAPDTPSTLYAAVKSLHSPFFTSYISAIAGIPDLKLLYCEPFIYTQGCFLSEHTDSLKQERKVAAIVHLSKDWTREDGGIYLYCTDNEHVKEYIPKFNTVLVSDIRNEELPHAVSTVKSDKFRLTLACWFC